MKLIILNGPWGVGKSTAARALHTQMPGAYHIELDQIRRSISGYDERPEESFRFAIRIASDIIERCLAEGRDVILDKMLRVHDLLDDIRAAGDRHGADVHEIILWAPKETVLARGEERGYSTGIFSREKAGQAWDQMHAIVPDRPHAVVLATQDMTRTDVLKAIMKAIAKKSP